MDNRYGSLVLETRVISAEDLYRITPHKATTRIRFDTATISAVSVWAGFILGPLLVAISYSYAATHANDQLHYHLFWAGTMLAVAPAFLRLCVADVLRGERAAIVATFGLFCYLPKFLLDPNAPLYFDELAHWRQSETLFQTHMLFQPNRMVSMAQYFPGLHALTVDLQYFTGLSAFRVGEIVIALIHVLAVVGIFVLAERLFGSSRVAGLAAVIYAANPAFIYFDSQYAYESLAIGLVIWALVAVVHLQLDQANRSAWLAIATILSAACIVTHHLSSYALAVILFLITAVTLARARRGTEPWPVAWLTLGFSLAVLGGAITWAMAVAPVVVNYLYPYLTTGITQIAGILDHQQSARTLFAHSTVPGYERVFAVLSPPIMLAAALGGLALWRRSRPDTSAGPALMLCGLLYFGSIPFMFTGMASEGSRRSWAFSYIGLALLVAPTVPWALDRARGPKRPPLAAVVALLLGIVLVGNVTMFVNEQYRFPGPFVYGSDTRSLDAEMLAAAGWFRSAYGTRRGVVADRDTSMALYSYANERIAMAARKFPIWQLYFRSGMPSRLLLGELRQAGYDYLVVDKRMSSLMPRIGVYFTRDEPGAFVRTTPILTQAIKKFNLLPWVIKVYATDHLEIYRLDFGALQRHWRLSRSGKT